MQFHAKSGEPQNQRTGCMVVGVHEGKRLSPSAKAMDAASGGAIATVLRDGDLKKAPPGGTMMLYRPAGVGAERLLLVECGKEKEMTAGRFRQVAKSAMGALAGSAAREAISCLQEIEVPERDLDWKVRQLTTAAGEAVYRFVELKTDKKAKEKPPLRKFGFLTPDRNAAKTAEKAAGQGAAINAGADLARELANLPGNVCTPDYLAAQARKLGNDYDSIKVKVLDEKAMDKLGMGALLGVAKGSRQPPRLITMEYAGGRKKGKPIVLVGKGLTFDAGGISLKPAQAMDEMKYDMCGGASVIGTLKAVAELKLPLNVVGVVPSSENLPDGAANKPGDILTSMSGQTIEVLNTDAEGRLILADALTYSERYEPEVVIDIATLTGACVIALGKQASGLLTNDEPLAAALLAAGEASGDRAWRLPLWDEYQDQLKSPFADMANIGGREAGTITAACFLSRFTKKYTWAHLDIAGTAWNSGQEKGATGRPVPMLVQYLLDKGKG